MKARAVLVTADVAALAAGLVVAFGARAVARHHELLTARSLAHFVGEGLLVAVPALLFTLLVYGLYNRRRDDVLAIGASVAWAAAIAALVADGFGGVTVPLVSVVPAFFTTWAALALERRLLVPRIAGPRPALAD